MTLPLHGSNPDYLYKALNIPVSESVIDFSVNLNPFGTPQSLVEKWTDWLTLIEDYPDPEGKELINLIAKKNNVPSTRVMLGNGGAELITLLGRKFSGKHIGVVQPTFSEYEKVTKISGCRVSYVNLTPNEWQLNLKQLSGQLSSLDALFLCNPNNPTGSSLASQDLLKLLNMCEENNCFLIIDEAFYDFQIDNENLSHYVRKSNRLIIIRSLTKMYSIAGLRLGYLLANDLIISELKAYQPEWSVNAIALEAGKKCITETEFVKKTQLFIQKERGRMVKILNKAGYQLSASTVNFYLLKDPSLDTQRPLIKYLLKTGIVPRHTENFPGLDGQWLRFAIRREQENNMLAEALIQWKQKN